jgi:hypothetical protein
MSEVLRNFSQNHRFARSSLLFLLALNVVTTGCASLNAGGAVSTSSTKTPIAMSASLPAAIVGSTYNATVTVSGGVAPYSFSLSSGQLPPGLVISSDSGSISGKPRRAGSYAFMITVLDNSRTAEGVKKFALTVKPPPLAAPPVQVAISPVTYTMAAGTSHQFSATVSNASNSAVTWSASAGTVTSTGLFTAPNVNIATPVQVTAASNADPQKRSVAAISVTPPTPSSTTMTMSSASLPEATEGIPYSASLDVSGGTAPYHWKVAHGSLPSGFSLDPTQGAINGITSVSGASIFTVAVADASGHSVSHNFTINVSTGITGNVDGPAELPRIYVKTSMADTPAPGGTVHVMTRAALQTALNSAKCGDSILLEAGATFDGTIVLPAKNCDDNHWIIIRTSAPDSALPPEGTRLTPCYAGVAALPGRPSFACSSTKNVMPKLTFSSTGSGPVIMADGANHYRLIGLEITRGIPKTLISNLVINVKGGISDHIIIDRSWLHGTAQDETTRGIMLTSSTYVGIVDSFFTDFHCDAMGTCTDSQAIGGGIGTHAMGPYKIVNNFLESSGENVIFGGGGADHTPEDIEIRRNHLFKPLTWMKGQPGFVGGRNGRPFIVKNLFELKNGIRVLFEGNVLENSWGGFSQTGFAILLTPKNQNNLCPLCVVHDVTIRYNAISHVGNGFQIANVPSVAGGISQGMWNVSIHDVLIDDIDGGTYAGGGHLFQQSNASPLVLHDVVINHVTALSKNTKAAMITVGNNKSYPAMNGFIWSNNIFTGGIGITTTGGGAINCAYRLESVGVLNNCFKQPDFSHNAIIAGGAKWPPENFAAASRAEVKFANVAAQSFTGYRLQPSSPYAHAGTDGKDLGADVEALSAAVAGVR